MEINNHHKDEPMTHAAKKISKGHYAYRDYTIENMAEWDADCKFWNVKHNDDESAHDSCNTLAGAKALIDWYYEQEAQAAA